MKRYSAVLLLAALVCIIASLTSCASSGSDRGVYYGTGGSIHADAFPETYGWDWGDRTRVGRPSGYYY
jgi:hypothetical protein